MERILNVVAGTLALLLILMNLVTCVGVAAAADPAVESIEQAREALNQAKYAKAARLFAETRERARERELVAQTLYWEAFSRYRLQGTEELLIAAELLARLDEQYFDLEDAGLELAAEGEALAARIDGELARRGDAGSVRRVREQASAEDLRMETRVAALQALLRLDPERAQPVLEKILRDDSSPNRKLRTNAVILGCQKKDQGLQAVLLDLLETETDPEFLTTVIMCLSRNPSSEVLDKLMGLFQRHPDPDVSQAILVSVARQGNADSSEKVFNFLAVVAQDGNSDIETRQHAIMALGMTDRAEEVLPLLLDILENESDRELLEHAMMALSRLDNPGADEALRGLIKHPGLDEEFKSQALFAASMHGRTSVAFLRDVFNNAETRDLKLQACQLLTRHEDESAALDAFLEFARNEKDPRLKQQMVFWMGQFDDPRAADFLMEILNEQ